MKAPAFQMYAQDFDMDTASWSNDEVGIYVRLLNYEWVNGGLPSDLSELSRIAREKKTKFEKKWIKNVRTHMRWDPRTRIRNDYPYLITCQQKVFIV